MNGGSDHYEPYNYLKECNKNFNMHTCKLSWDHTYITQRKKWGKMTSPSPLVRHRNI